MQFSEREMFNAMDAAVFVLAMVSWFIIYVLDTQMLNIVLGIMLICDVENKSHLQNSKFLTY